MPNLVRKPIWFVGGLIIVLGAGTATYLAACHSKQEANQEGTQPPTASAPESLRPVKVYRVKPAEATTRTYAGVISPRRETDLGFRVPGKVVARLVEVGDHVAAGQVIARLDVADYELAVKISEADLVGAEAEARNAAKEEARYRELSKSGAASASEVDRAIDGRTAADARVERASRALAQAQNRLAYCALTADVNGVVTALPVEVGQVVGEGTPVARVAHAGELEAVISLPENRADDATGPAQMTVWGELGTSYNLTLRELSPAVDPTTRTYQARFTIQNPNADVALGRTVTVKLQSGGTQEIATLASTGSVARGGEQGNYFVPLASLFDHEGVTSVWRVVGDQLEIVSVEVVAYLEQDAVVRGDIQLGDLIVAAGVQKIDGNLRVRPWETK